MKRFILIKTLYDKLEIIDTYNRNKYDDYVYEDETKKYLCGEIEEPYEDERGCWSRFIYEDLGDIIKESNSREVLEKLIIKLEKENNYEKD